MSRPRSLYAHIPFCERKCPYCAFNSYAGAESSHQDRYVEALLRELAATRGPKPLDLDTIYIGGGTPTALEANQLGRVLDAIRDALHPKATPEWTVEVNPGTTTPARLDALVDAGVNRVSMGVQSMDAARLKKLGRVHSADDVRDTVEGLRDRGIDNINLDLIYGQPDQSTASFISDVDAILALEPDHISLYALQWEEGTPYTAALEKGRLQDAAEDVVLASFEAGRARLAEDGLVLYEISNFAKPGRTSRHNRNYWRNRPYYGLGAGAYGCVDGERRLNELDPQRYIERMFADGHACVSRELLSSSDRFVETLSSGLRTTEGVHLEELFLSTGIDAREVHGEHLKMIEDRGLGQVRSDRLTLELDGLWVLDTLLEPFLDGLTTDVTSA